MLGLILCIMIGILGIKIFYEGKINDDDSDEEKKTKTLRKKIGICFIVISAVLELFCIFVYFL